MVSTHYNRPNGITPQALKQVDDFVVSLLAKLRVSGQWTEQQETSSIFSDAGQRR
jgi:hypothetical protein